MLINGDFRLSTYAVPAYTSSLTLTTTLKMVIERWFAYAPAGSPTCTQTAGSDGQHQFVYQCTGAASTTGIYIGQRILATNSSYVAGKSVTLGIDLADSTLTSATCALSYANSTNTWGSVASPTVTAIGSQTFTISSTLTRYNYTFTVPSAATTGLQLLCNVGAQTSGTFTVGNVQLEIGTQATPFERIPQGLEYMQASTYHVELSGYANLYGTCSTYANLGTAVLYSTTNGNGTIPIPTQMWKSPTITTAGTFQFENSTDPTITSFSVDDQMGAQLNVDIVTATSTSGTLGIMRWNNTACTTQRFTIEAETTL